MRPWLEVYRKSAGLTSKEMAKRMGISQAGYSLIETGQRQKSLDVNTIKRIAKALGKTPAEIMEAEIQWTSAS